MTAFILVSAPSGAPVVTAQNFTLSTPGTNGQNIGSPLSATNSPTLWQIVGGSGNFQINSATGQLQVSAAGVPGLVTGSEGLFIRASNGAWSATVECTVLYYADGSVGAPSGTAQYPNLLAAAAATNGTGCTWFVTHPQPWKVPGVDYYVGIDRSLFPTNASLTPGLTGTLPTGCTRSGNVITASPTSGNPITLNGFDFSNMQVIFNNTGFNLTISNCMLQIGSNNLIAVTDTGAGGGALTMVNCEFDGNGAYMNANFTFAQNQGIVVWLHGTNSVFEYCYFHDIYCDAIRPDINGTRHCSVTIEYCLHVNGSFNTQCHADFMQVNAAEPSNSSVDNALIQFNTYYQTNAGGNNLNSGFRFNTQCSSPVAQYNTMIVASNAQVDTYMEFVEDITDSPSQITSGVLRYNYVNPDLFGHNAISTATTGGYPKSNIVVTESGNVNLLNGATITG